VLFIVAASTARGQGSSESRGPAEIRDEHLLAQPRLTLPAASAATLEAGRWKLEAGGLWSNSFAWTQDEPGENPAERAFLVDGESLTLDLTVRRGLRPGWEMGLRLPLRWRGGGVMDEGIDVWHRWLHLPDGDRPDFLSNAFRVEGLLQEGEFFSWSKERGTGLGNLELETRWRISGPEDEATFTLAGRLALPTGTGAFDDHGAGAGLQLLTSAPLSTRFDLHAGLGGTLQSRGPVERIEYEPFRFHAFVAVEWRPWRSFSLVAETNAASRLVSNIQSYPGTHWLLDVSGKRSLGRSAEIVVGFTENVVSQQATTDFALHAAISLRR
jgi:hypothetical protein